MGRQLILGVVTLVLGILWLATWNWVDPLSQGAMVLAAAGTLGVMSS